MSINNSVIFFKFAVVKFSPFTLILLLPFMIFLDIIRVPSSSISTFCSLSCFLKFSFFISNSSSIKASLLSSLTISFGTLPPSAIKIEPIIIDLPAPVSPVIIFKPSFKKISTLLISARFFTFTFTNILFLRFCN